MTGRCLAFGGEAEGRQDILKDGREGKGGGASPARVTKRRIVPVGRGRMRPGLCRASGTPPLARDGLKFTGKTILPLAASPGAGTSGAAGQRW